MTDQNQDLAPEDEKDETLELSPEDFQKQKASLLEGREPEETKPAETEKKKADETGTKPDETGQTGTKPDEPNLKEFSLDPKPADDAEEATEEIIHNGQTRKLTKSQVKALAQKGFDYDFKLQQLTPHRNLVNAITHDQALAGIVNDYLTSGGKSWRLPPAAGGQAATQAPDGVKIKSIHEYSGDNAADDWLKDNMKAIEDAALKRHGIDPTTGRPAEHQPAQPAQTAASGKHPLLDTAQMVLKHRDPENYEKVMPTMISLIPKLTQEQAQVIEAQAANGDLTGVIALYDHTKRFVVGNNGGGSPRQNNPGKPNFRMKPDGGKASKAAPASEDDPNYIWTLPAKDFQAEIRKAKGF